MAGLGAALRGRCAVCTVAATLACAPGKGAPGGAGDSDSGAPVDSVPFAVPLAGCYGYHTAAALVGEQTLHLWVDSGSSTTAVASDLCTNCAQESVSQVYDTAHGTATGLGADATYLNDDSWVGRVFRDDVTLGEAPAVNMAFAAITRQNWMFRDYVCDYATESVPLEGILGLGPDDWRDHRTNAYLRRLTRGSVPDSFALRLCHAGGTLWLGGFDSSVTTGEMVFADMVDPGYFIDVRSFEVWPSGGASSTVTASETSDSLPAFLDSGDSALIVPSAAYAALTTAITADPAFAALGDAAWWTSPEGTTLSTSPAEMNAALPRLVVHLSGDAASQLILPATESYLLQYELAPGSYLYLTNLYSDGDSDLPSDFLDLGNLPMYSYVVYTDRENSRVGFAPAVPCEDEE